MKKLTLKDLSLKGQRVLMRVDYNVPIENGAITDDARIAASLPSIEYVLKQGASLILMSHLGRPKGKEAALSLAPCAQRLSELLGKPVAMAKNCVGPAVEKEAASLKPGQILMLENLRFHPEEEAADPSFAKQLAKLGTCYVNDAFGTAHRAHASTATIASSFPDKAAMGFLMEKEVTALSSLLRQPKRPFYTLLGGAKVSTKIGVIRNLLDRVDALFIGGAMAFTFLKAKGISIGDSPFEDPALIESLSTTKLHLPLDLVIGKEGAVQTVSVQEGIPAGWQGMDIGPRTVADWSKQLKGAATIFWNGPLGVFEKPPFDAGTRGIAECLAGMQAQTIVGGGDSVAAVQQMGLGGRFTHLSTGGGASLEFLEAGHLPGIDALTNK